MRIAYHSVELLEGEVDGKNAIVGVSLGYDFCAEHECGVKELKSKLGVLEVRPKTFFERLGLKKYENVGVNARIIRNVGSIQSGMMAVFVRKGNNRIFFKRKPGYKKVRVYYFETFNPWVHGGTGTADNARKSLLENTCFFQGNKELVTEWDGKDFRVLTTNEDLFKTLVGALVKNQLCFGLTGDSNPFANDSLTLLDANALPDATKKIIEEKDLEYLSLQQDAEKLKKPLDKKIKEAGLGYFALKPKRIKKERMNDYRTKHDVVFWLNPRDQRKFESGWYGVEELIDWTKGVGPVIKNSNDGKKL